MIKTKYKYSGKEFEIVPYKSDVEKEFLLLQLLTEPTLDAALEIAGVHEDIISGLTDAEKIAMLYKFRELSVGTDVNLKFKCSACDAGNENEIDISNVITSSNITNELIVDQFKPVTEENFHEFVKCDIDELDLDEYEALYKEVQNTVTAFDFRKPTFCQKCGAKNFIRIDRPGFVVDNMSEDTLMGLYQTYNDLIFFGKYTKQDIDSLYPFERIFAVTLLNKTREDLNK